MFKHGRWNSITNYNNCEGIGDILKPFVKYSNKKISNDQKK